ncbi:MAG TPA: CapA family protein [Candidatus Paceibacterota bacterium]|nr:CapA family protein [Candidatus Paceibacterota bacterium]
MLKAAAAIAAIAFAIGGVFLLRGGGEVAARSDDAQHIPAAGKPATILAFGDLMLDRYVRADIEKYGETYPLQLIAPSFAHADIVVANAEGVFTTRPSLSIAATSTLRFTFDPAMLPVLKRQGIDVLSQANNHADDFGASGLLESQRAIIAAGLATFGDPSNRKPGPYLTTIEGQRVAFIGYNQFTGGGDASVRAAIADAKALGAFVIVYPHWGIEYDSAFTPLQQEEAHRFVDAGADAVLGSHPHVIEPIELYHGKPIFYSLGNFIFDQAPDGPTAEGLAVSIALSSTTASYRLLPFAIRHAQVVPMDSEDARAALAAIASSTEAALGRQPPGLASGMFSVPR